MEGGRRGGGEKRGFQANTPPTPLWERYRHFFNITLCYIAGVFLPQGAHSLASLWSHDI